MQKNILLSTVAMLGLMAFNAKALDGNIITNTVSVALVGHVQQNEVTSTNASGTVTNYSRTTTNLTLNTKSLLKMIAADQGFNLPTNASLGMIENTFVVLNKDKSIFTNVTVMGMTKMAEVDKGDLKLTAKNAAEAQTGTQVGTISYNGTNSTIGFTLYFLASDSYTAKNNFTTNGVPVVGTVSESFSGSGHGPGICQGNEMVISGSMSGGGKGPGFVEE